MPFGNVSFCSSGDLVSSLEWNVGASGGIDAETLLDDGPSEVAWGSAADGDVPGWAGEVNELGYELRQLPVRGGG